MSRWASLGIDALAILAAGAAAAQTSSAPSVVERFMVPAGETVTQITQGAMRRWLIGSVEVHAFCRLPILQGTTISAPPADDGGRGSRIYLTSRERTVALAEVLMMAAEWTDTPCPPGR